ncbi:hypothetical protein GMD78_09620 [Ornithinibacillus sp. L9]|uniref:Uncharacterized protein n=1 Tax=Ornithinibacillus caprae TaxID=2678566 RepID=A0A6N8FMS8_9BACI|nr:CBO0543 family protein [Ornithinibacillus caprae]MUK88648.1 hypothetical protein [Ornithinibacillus caprae]
MQKEQQEWLEKLRFLTEELTRLQNEYWWSYSGFGTWQLWAIVLLIIIPLIILFVVIDRRKILLIGFFGLSYHVWFHYLNATGIRFGLWEYPYQLLPFLPSFVLDAALIPICYMLVYQWTLNYNKNIYLYAGILSAIFAFLMKPILVNLEFFIKVDAINYFYIFLIYYGIFLVAKGITSLFLHLQQKEQ